MLAVFENPCEIRALQRRQLGVADLSVKFGVELLVYEAVEHRGVRRAGPSFSASTGAAEEYGCGQHHT